MNKLKISDKDGNLLFTSILIASGKVMNVFHDKGRSTLDVDINGCPSEIILNKGQKIVIELE